MKAYGGVDVKIHVFLTSALGGVVSFRPRPLYPGERAPGTNWIGGWVGPRTGLDDVERRKLLPLPGLELRTLCHPVRMQSLYRLRYPGSSHGRFLPQRFQLIIHYHPIIPSSIVRGTGSVVT
jgi:hypothetical protein